MLGRLEDVLDGDQPLQFETVIDDQYALEPVPVHQGLGVLEIRPLGYRDQPLTLGHDVGDGLVEVGLETQVAIGYDADNLAAVDDRQARDPVQLGEREHFAHRHVWRHGDRLLDDTALEAFHACHLGSLRPGRHVLVNDPETAFLCDCDGEPRFGDAVHRRRKQGNVQGDAPREASLQADVARNDGGMSGKQQDVVESQRLLDDTHGAFLLCAKADYTRVVAVGKRAVALEARV